MVAFHARLAQNMFGRAVGVERDAGPSTVSQGGPDAERSNASNKLPWKTTPRTGATMPRVLATTPRPAFDASCVNAHQGKSAATRVSSGVRARPI